jgi:hypothetical protein
MIFISMASGLCGLSALKRTLKKNLKTFKNRIMNKYNLSVCDMTFTSKEELYFDEWSNLSYKGLYQKVQKFCLEYRSKHLDREVVFTVGHTDEFFMSPKVNSILNYVESNKHLFFKSEYEFVDRKKNEIILDVHLNYEDAMKLELDRRESYSNCYQEKNTK